MDIFSQNFIPALRAKDYLKAREVLDIWQKEVSSIMYKWGEAILYRDMGEARKAYEILSDIIDNKNDEGRICQYRRAENYLDDKMYLKALADFDVILEDKRPKTAEIYHEACLISKAFILAVLGDHQFNDVIDKLAPDAENFITDVIYDKVSLIKIYSATKKPERVKPKLE